MTREAPFPSSPYEVLFGPLRDFDLDALEKRVRDRDPIALYQAVQLCISQKKALPRWLTESLLEAIAGYHLGKKAGKKGSNNNPLAKIAKRIEIDVRRRAVAGVRKWQSDQSQYQLMPTKSIECWYDGDIEWTTHTTFENALEIAQDGLRGLAIRQGGPLIKCSPITLKRTFYSKTARAAPPIPPEIAVAFGLNDPDTFFGTDMPLPDHLKQAGV